MAVRTPDGAAAGPPGATTGDTPPARRQRRNRFGLALLLLVVVFGVAEVGLRLTGGVAFRAPPGELPPAVRDALIFRKSEVPGLAYELVPGASHAAPAGIGAPVQLNSLGFRGPEPLPDGAPRTRIVALGDSFTFGYGVEVQDAWPARLAERLSAARRAGEPPVEVLNLGVGGYATHDEAIVLRERALALQPDLVIVGYALNDPDVHPVDPLHEHWYAPAWWQHSAALRKLAELRWGWTLKAYGGDTIRWGHADAAAWGTVTAAFDDMATAADAADVPRMLVIFPVDYGTPWEHYRYRREHEQVAAAARAAGFEVLDLLPEYAPHDPDALRVSPDDGHPSPAAHALAADAIARRLAERPELLRP